MASPSRDAAIDRSSSAGATPFPPNPALRQYSFTGKRAGDPPMTGDLNGACSGTPVGAGILPSTSVSGTVTASADKASGIALDEEVLLPDVTEASYEGGIPPPPCSKGKCSLVHIFLCLDTYVSETR